MCFYPYAVLSQVRRIALDHLFPKESILTHSLCIKSNVFCSTYPPGSISAALSCPSRVPSLEVRGLISLTAAGNRAYVSVYFV